MIPSHSSQFLSPSPYLSPLCALSVSAFGSPDLSSFTFIHSIVNSPSLSLFLATLTDESQLTENSATLSPVSATLTSRVKHNSFVCHSYKKYPGWGSAIVNFFVAQTSVCALLRQSTSERSAPKDQQELKNLAVRPVTNLESPFTTSALFLSPVTGHQSRVTKSFTIRTYEKPASNPFRIRTSKTQALKPFRMNTYRKTGEGVPHARQLLCRGFAGGLGIRIECNRHGNRALAARCKFPLSHRLFGGICQRRVSAQHLHILHRPIRVDGNLQSHRPANAPSLQDGRILCIHLLHYFAVMVIVLRPARRQAHQRQDEARDYRGVSHPALRYCHHAALKQRYGTPVGDHPHPCVFLCRTNVAVLSPSPRVFRKRVPQAHGTGEALDKLL